MAITQKEKEQKISELKQYIAEKKNIDGPLMPIMQKAQGLFGYLPLDVQMIIAEGLDIPVTEVYGVATFYSQFSLEPKGDKIISVCTGTACYVKGAQAVLEEVEKVLGVKCGQTTPDGKFTLAATRCLGCCGLAPVMVVDEDVYGQMTASKVAAVLAKY